VTLDRAGSHEERLGDLAVREAPAGELGDPAFARRQRVETRESDPSRARTGGAELGLGALGEPFGACTMSGVKCLAKQLSSFGAAIAPPKHRTEVSKSPCSFHNGATTIECVDRFTK